MVEAQRIKACPFKTGKFPVCELRISLSNEAGNPLQVVLALLQELGNCVNGLLPLEGVGIAPNPASMANEAG